MSIELGNETKLLGQVASNRGYADLREAVDQSTNHSDKILLSMFFEHGYTVDIDGVKKALDRLANKNGVDENVAKTAHGIVSLMSGQKFVVLTDGTSNDEE